MLCAVHAIKYVWPMVSALSGAEAGAIKYSNRAAACTALLECAEAGQRFSATVPADALYG